MSRKKLYSLFACLLCLLPVLIQAQSLTRYEYWFDDNFSSRVSKSISGTDVLVKLSIDTDQLDNGIHKFSFRAKQSDGYYSAVTSSLFLKRPAAQNSVMEYWFDDNIDQRESMSISNTEDEQTFELDLRDNAKYPWGFHQLNMRITLEGGGESAVYSSPVLKLSAGKATQLEYWIDDDFANAHTISGSLASDGQDYLFVNDLDLGDVSPGHHRLYCRAVSSSGKTASAVTMAPILVKPLVRDDVTMMQYTIAIDDGVPQLYPIKNAGQEVEVVHTIDGTQLAKGKHKLTMNFWNSLLNSVTDSATFMVNTTGFKLNTPDPETFKATDITETGFTANWEKVDGALYYDILVKHEGGDYEHPDYNGGSSVNSAKVIGLNPNTSYFFQVRARNDNPIEKSDWSPSIPKAVKTSDMGTTTADLVIHSNKGFDGSSPLVLGQCYHYNMWIANTGNYPWQGSFYLKDGNEDIKGWYKISIPENSVRPLEFDYTPQSAGTKAFVLYYQTMGKGSGIPVETREGGSNIMLVQVNPNTTFNDGLHLSSAIDCPESIRRGDKCKIMASIKNDGNYDWTGSLYITDNGLTLKEKEVTLRSGKEIQLIANEWAPETMGTHQIGVYYKADRGFNWNLVSGNGFTNPAPVEVLAADAFSDVTFATITHVTKDVVPQEVTEGSKVFYYFRIADENGNRLKGLRMLFKCENSQKSFETTSSGDDGIVELCLETDGTNKIAERGETVKLTCTGLIKNNNEIVRFYYEPEDGEIELTVHQGNYASEKTGIENIENMRFTLDLGVSGKWELGNMFKLNAGLSMPVSFSTKFDDHGDFKNFTLDSKAKVNVNGSIGEFAQQKVAKENGDFNFLPSASMGINGGYHYSINSDTFKSILVRMAMSLCENYTIGSNKFTDKAVKTLMEWYIAKNHVNETRNWFVGGELGISADVLNIEIPSVIKRTKKIPFMNVDKLNLSGKINMDFDLGLEKDDYGNNLHLIGDSYTFKIGGSFSAKATCGKWFEDAKYWWKTIAHHDFYRTQVDNFFKSVKFPTVQNNHTLSIKSDEFIDSKNNYKEISHKMSLSDGWDVSFSDLNIPLTSLDASIGWSATSSVKLSSKEDWATYIGNIINSSSNDTKYVYQLYPHLDHKYLLCSPADIFAFWADPPNGVLEKLASKAPDPSKYKLKEAFKIEHSLSSEATMGVKLPISDWLKLTFDVGAKVELENKPNESYYSIMDKRIMPVTVHPTTSLWQVISGLIKTIAHSFNGIFDDDRKDIEPIYIRMQDVYGVGSVSGNTLIEVPGLPHYVTPKDDDNNSDNGSEAGGSGTGGGSSRVPKRLFEINEVKRFHYGLDDFNSNYARYITHKHPRLAEKIQSDICTFTFNFNNGVQNFDEGIMIEIPHYYPAGDLLAITDQGDTLFVVSEVVDVTARKGETKLDKTQRGEFEITGNVGVDDLTPFGFSEDQSLDVYFSDEDSNTWYYVGPAGTPLKVDKCGSYMMATSIKSDTEAPLISASFDESTGMICFNVADNIGVMLSSLQVYVNGELRDVSMINQSNFELQLSNEDLKYMIVVNAIIEDLAGNQGYLFQVFNIDKPDNTDIDDKKTDNKTTFSLNKRKLTVNGTSPEAVVTVYAMNGLVQASAKTDANGHVDIHLNSLLEGVYIVTTSDGKSKKLYIR